MLFSSTGFYVYKILTQLHPIKANKLYAYRICVQTSSQILPCTISLSPLKVTHGSLQLTHVFPLVNVLIALQKPLQKSQLHNAKKASCRFSRCPSSHMHKMTRYQINVYTVTQMLNNTTDSDPLCTLASDQNQCRCQQHFILSAYSRNISIGLNVATEWHSGWVL